MSANGRTDIFLVTGPQTKIVKKCNVAASSTIIYPGDPVTRAAGDVAVVLLATGAPAVATDFVEGIAESVSTNTAAKAGTVDVIQNIPGQIWAIKPNDTTAWDTQAEYDALVGKRVLIDLTSTTYTILADDQTVNGCVIEAKNVKTSNPGWVYFTFRHSTRPNQL